MKKVLMLFMAAMLMLIPTATLGAIHPWTGDFSPSPILAGLAFEGGIFYIDPLVKIDCWYGITPKSPSVEFIAGMESNFTILGAEYYLNDQTFVEYFSFDDLTALSGSYLFTNNVFVGMLYMTESSDVTTISVGYRWGLGKDGYISLSWDYFSFPSSDGNGYELNGVYYGEKYKFFGQVYYIDSSGGDSIYDLGFNYQFTDTLTGGLSYWQMGDEITLFGVGLTWSPEFMIFDAQVLIDDEDDYNITLVNAMFKATDQLSLGLESIVASEAHSAFIYIKGKYLLKSGAAIKGAYLLGDDHHDSYLSLGYQMNLK